MPENRWAAEVRARLSDLRLSPAREAEIVDELSHHLDERYRELISGGTSPDDATRITLSDGRMLGNGGPTGVGPGTTDSGAATPGTPRR